MGKNPIVSVTYENKRISIKKQLTLHKMCVTCLLCGNMEATGAIGAKLRPFSFG